MVNDVMERIDLVVQCSGSRSISKENLTFLFDKYELDDEDQKAVMKYCEDHRISVFEEISNTASSDDGNDAEDNSSKKPEKKSFFARLFGR